HILVPNDRAAGPGTVNVYKRFAQHAGGAEQRNGIAVKIKNVFITHGHCDLHRLIELFAGTDLIPWRGYRRWRLLIALYEPDFADVANVYALQSYWSAHTQAAGILKVSDN